MSTDVDARLDLLSLLRERGYAGSDVTLAEDGLQFLVSLEAMQRLVAALPGPMLDESGELLHGEELDKAIERSAQPQDMGICETALHTRCRLAAEKGIMELTDITRLGELRQELISAGQEPTEHAVQIANLRHVLGGLCAFGMSVGMEVQKMKMGVGD
jgi:hypothetical protein